ncbi:hypothetical protein [Streptomyces sp. NPDC058572]|uniref:hypothetical protein n=1 Tax=Streptomyces sp. NPDC058572 TaxID=3346546 RepID=UPI00364FAD61
MYVIGVREVGDVRRRSETYAAQKAGGGGWGWKAAAMSGFTRDTKRYGDRLVYEALGLKWGRYHGVHCGCPHNWVTEHAEPAGFEVVGSGSGWVALVGPGLTEGVDEDALTANVLWEAVTGKPGTQDWYEQVRVTCRCDHCEAERKAGNDAAYAARRERTARAKVEPATEKQIKYLNTLVAEIGRERFDAAYANAVKGTTVAPRSADEKTGQALKRLTKAAAWKLISELVGP